MVREFVMNRLWVWMINGVVCAGCYIAYFCIAGKEITYSLYIPLDILLVVAKQAFYWWYYYLDILEKKEEAEIAAVLNGTRNRLNDSREPLLATED